MCLEAIDKYSSEKDRVFDIGTGSGILAIAAAKLGAREVIGVDLDIVAVASAKENVAHNQLKNVQILKGNLLDVVEGKADLVVANIIAEVIKYITSDVKKVLKDKGIFIASGIIKEKEEFVKEELSLHGFIIKDVKREGEWVCIISEANHA
jgi:ribosomal protein L11 methyltransferase